VKRPKNNLRPEGEFAKQIPKRIEPAERRSPIKHPDNLKPEDDDSEQDVPAHQNNSRILRDRKSIKPPDRYQANLVEYDEPSSYEEAITTEDADDWKRAIDEELQVHELNGTWTFENLPEGRKTIGSKCVFKKKYVTHTNTHKYKARLCAKGFTQKQEIDYQEAFVPVARYNSDNAGDSCPEEHGD